MLQVRREDATVVRSHPSLFPSVCQFEARRQCLVVSSSVYPSTKRKNYCASDELAVRQDHITPDINLQKKPMTVNAIDLRKNISGSPFLEQSYP